MVFSIVCEIVFITFLAVSQSQDIKLELKGDLFNPKQTKGGDLTYTWKVSNQPSVTDANCEISKGEQAAGIILKTEFKLTSPNNWRFPDYTFVINWPEDSAKAPQITWNDLSPVRTSKFNSDEGTVEWIFIDGNLHATQVALTYIGKGGKNKLPNKLPVKKCKKKPTPKTTPTTSNSLNKLIDILLQQYAKQYTTTPSTTPSTTPYMGGFPSGTPSMVGFPSGTPSMVGFPSGTPMVGYTSGTPVLGGYPYTLRGGTSAVGLPYRGAVGLPSRGGYPYTLRGGTSAVGFPSRGAVGLPSRGGYPYTLRGGTSAVGFPSRGAVGLPSRGGDPYTLRGGTSAVGFPSRGAVGSSRAGYII